MTPAYPLCPVIPGFSGALVGSNRPIRLENRPSRGSSKASVHGDPAASKDQQHPLFCLRYLTKKFDLQAIQKPGCVAFAKSLYSLSQLSWDDIRKSGKYQSGYEMLPRGAFKAPVPSFFEKETGFMVFRYHGTKPMAGVRRGRIFHVLWIESAHGKLYDHD